MSLKLIAPQGYPKALAVQLTAQIANVPLEFEEISWKQTNTPEFQNRNPIGVVPLLETPNGNVAETNAILRHFARLSPNKGLYGESDFESAQVDSQLDFNNTELQPMCFAFSSAIWGWVPFNQDRYELAKNDLQKLLTILNDSLEIRTYLVGQKMSIADIAIFATIFPLFKFILEEESRKQFSNVTRWFMHIASQPLVIKYFGKIFLCKKEWTLEGQSQVQAQPQQQKQQQEEKKQQQKKEPKKQEKKEPKKQEKKEKKVEVEAPVKKEGNPLDALPPSKFDLYSFKTQIANSKDKSESVQFLIDNFDPQGFSVYYAEYEKYEGEGIKLFLTSNLKDSVLQRLDHFRKYQYGTYGVYGEEGNYEICGVWLWRGVGIPQEIKDLPNYDYHKWQKLDLTNKDDQQTLKDCWTGLEEDKSIFKGRVNRDVTVFK